MNTKTLSKKDIDPQSIKQVKAQDYSKKPVINGVKIVDLNIFNGEDGYFLEIGRPDEKGKLPDFPDFAIKQIGYSVVLPGSIKAWHIHFNQEDVWFVPPESMILAGLFDVRKNSPTKGSSMRITLGNHKAKLLFIPRGVAHGSANISSSASSVLYVANQCFDIKKPDEYRLPWDHFGKDFWKSLRG